MYDQHQGTHTGEIASPWECHQGYGGDMVNEHLPKVFSFDVKKLGNAQGPIETQFNLKVKRWGKLEKKLITGSK